MHLTKDKMDESFQNFIGPKMASMTEDKVYKGTKLITVFCFYGQPIKPKMSNTCSRTPSVFVGLVDLDVSEM